MPVRESFRSWGLVLLDSTLSALDYEHEQRGKLAARSASLRAGLSPTAARRQFKAVRTRERSNNKLPRSPLSE